ncbi:MAG: hypothetical protein LQ340_001917 [Diploschistes diacapsis]|nr:MAG: hypothetical protein LQ340_001917 [Diploschistes diacapsis]
MLAGALQTLGLIPREPSPIPLAQRNLETLTHEETRQLVEQLQSKVDAYTKVKNEWEDLSGVKRPFNVKPDEELSVIGARKSQRPATNDEVIDLD